MANLSILHLKVTRTEIGNQSEDQELAQGPMSPVVTVTVATLSSESRLMST
jgi:hypothetical protein